MDSPELVEVAVSNLANLENLVYQNTIQLNTIVEQLNHFYAAMLFVCSVGGVLLVLYLLYSFLKKCY